MKAEWTNKDSLTSCETTGKSILVIDTPKECGWGCPCYRDSEYSDGFCSATCENVSIDELKIPSICPLKPMPSNLPPDVILKTRANRDYVQGWNDCLEGLEK